jgi:eukaryotic-like serine/threonine-protein kinase
MVVNSLQDQNREYFDYFYLRHLQIIRGEQGQYYNLRYLGKGGNGTTFLVSACQGELRGVQLALKVFHRISRPERQRAFLDEITRLRNFDHPAITKVYDQGEYRVQDRFYPFVVVEYVPLTIRSLIVSRELDRIHAIRFGLNCLSALHYIHTQNPQVVHRDLKPENILVSGSLAKIADFGLAKELINDTDNHENVNTQIEENHSDIDIGTQWPGMPSRYRTPELVLRAADQTVRITTKSDIFQFGTVFYEMLTLINPQRQTRDQLGPIDLDLRLIQGEQGQELSNLIESMHSLDPNDRPSAESCLQQLDNIHRQVLEAYCRILGTQI